MASAMEAVASATSHVPAPPSTDGPGNVSDRTHQQQLGYNDSGAPSWVNFAIGNFHHDRPKPVPPNRKVTMIPERPSTSGGPSSKTSNGFVFDKRMSRDDFYVTTRPSAGARFARGQLPTPEGSPQSRPFTRSIMPPPHIRVPTPESFDDAASIGMAIGSPTQQPAGWASPVQQQTLLQPAPSINVSAFSPVSATSNVDTYDVPAPKKQMGRWKLFGRFRKQSVTTNNAMTISEPNSLVATSSRQSSESDVRPVSRSNTLSGRKAPKHKPLMARSNTMPSSDPQNAESLQVYKKRTAGRNASTDTFAANAHLRSTSNFGSIPIALDTGGAKQPSGRLLDVEIPDITMERYSIMFGSVLQQGPQPASSLLARRQATLERLKNISDAIEREEEEKHVGRSSVSSLSTNMSAPSNIGAPIDISAPTNISVTTEREEEEKLLGRLRGASSPPPAKSPGFALFPQPPSHRPNQQQSHNSHSSHSSHISHSSRNSHSSHNACPVRSLRLHRSNTSPATLNSPLKGQFDQSQTIGNHTSIISNGSSKSMPRGLPSRPREVLEQVPEQAVLVQSQTQVQVEAPEPQTPTKRFQFSPETSGLILESPSDIDDEPSPVLIKTQTIRPDVVSPQWQMINPSTYTPSIASTTTTATTTTTSTRRRSPSSISSVPSSVQTHITTPSIDLDEPDNIKIMNPVELSIARQISVSRQQRKMLQPLKTAFPSPPRHSPSKTSPMPMIAMGKNERLAETKSATPTLITPRETFESHLAQHRKSELVVLEG